MQLFTVVVTKQLRAVIVAEQEAEASPVGAQSGQVVAVGPDLAAERVGKQVVVGAGELLADEGQRLGELGRVDDFQAHLGFGIGLFPRWAFAMRGGFSAWWSARPSWHSAAAGGPGPGGRSWCRSR